MTPIRVCFVCLGNICRSPTAEAVFLRAVHDAGLDSAFVVDSAGTSAAHAGERAHPETRAEATRRGVDVPSRSRRFVQSDFARFDHVVAMDSQNLSDLTHLAPDDEALAKLSLMRDWDPKGPRGQSVPDPYYERGFDGVFDICDRAARGLLAHLREAHGILVP